MAATDRVSTVRIGAALFLFTFLVYWALGPRQTAYDYQLSQANNILHGQLHLSEEYTRNLGTLERVLFDGRGFCLPLDDPRGPEAAEELDNVRLSRECRHYMQHSLGPSILLLPLVAVFGLNVNQTLLSALIGGLTAPLVFAITRRFSEDLRTQLALTALAMFGTILWWVASNGGVWFFAHTTAVLFLFAAIYATVGLRSPLLAGAFIGAAFLCRPTTILGGLFPLIAFADRWYVTRHVEEFWRRAVRRPPFEEFWRRVRWRPLFELALGVAPFVALGLTLNWLRFGNPFESGYNYSEEFHQRDLLWRWPYGVLDIRYIERHIPVVFEQMPNFGTTPAFVWPSWAGLAVWFTTPAFFYAFFVHLRRRASTVLAALGLAIACSVIFVRGVAGSLGGPDWLNGEVPFDLHLLPFWVLFVVAIVGAVRARDRLALGAWAALVAIAVFDFMFAATGWAQYGYRYSLDFMPFLFLLVVMAVGQRVRGHHLLLIGAGVVVNLWAVLWIYQFAPASLWGWTWVSF